MPIKNKKLAGLTKLIRVTTVAPVAAAVMITILFFTGHDVYYSPLHYAMAILFLVAFPLLAYPISVIIKRDKALRRDFQRSLAIVFAVIGYIAGALFAFLASDSTLPETVIYMTYLLSGFATALFSFVFKIKSSGHAAGVAGPIAVLISYLGIGYIYGLFILAAVYWSSLYLKRHTITQLITGSCVPVASMLISMYCLGKVI